MQVRPESLTLGVSLRNKREDTAPLLLWDDPIVILAYNSLLPPVYGLSPNHLVSEHPKLILSPLAIPLT